MISLVTAATITNLISHLPQLISIFIALARRKKYSNEVGGCFLRGFSRVPSCACLRLDRGSSRGWGPGPPPVDQVGAASASSASPRLICKPAVVMRWYQMGRPGLQGCSCYVQLECQWL
ncbi:hypothetical protein SRHO_G00307330 [Serrasalmus rhombeus]